MQGYKTISYEIIEKKKDDLPSMILIPSSSRGDLLWGIWQGFMEAQEMGYITKMPKLIAVEPWKPDNPSPPKNERKQAACVS